MIGSQTIKTQVGEVNLLLPNFDGIPEPLHQLPVAMWVAEPELDGDGNQKIKPNGKPRIKKAPRNSLGYNISKSNPAQWETLESCQAAFDPDRFSGVGVLLQADSGLVGIDLDEVKELLERIPTLKRLLSQARKEAIYCEYSPSNTGLRLFVHGQLPGDGGRRRGGIELYSDVAFLTVTGRPAWPGGVKDAQWLVDGLLDIIGGEHSDAANPTPTKLAVADPDAELVEALVDWAATNQPRLWEGRWQDPPGVLGGGQYPSQSEADMALVGHLVREGFNRHHPPEVVAASAMDAFAKSGLYRPEKHRQVADYAIPKAVASAQAQVVQPRPSIPPDIAEVNSRFALIEGMGIYDIRQGVFIQTEQFRLLYQNRLINIANSTNPRVITLDKVWLSSNFRAQFTGLEMSPGEGERTAAGALNTYRGFSVDPAPGDVQPFLDLLGWLIEHEADRQFFLHFLAYKVQQPTARYAIAAVLWSLTQGVGKNLLVETWASLFDEKHWGVVGQEVFLDQFTEWQHLKLAIVADEVSSTSSRAVENRIKGWVTANQNRINDKGQRKFQEPNLTTYVFLSNHSDAVFMDDTDRRFWVVECTGKRPDKSLIRRYVSWRDEGGKAHLLDYLLNLDTGGFDPREPAPMTRAKREMIEDNKSDLERWLDRILISEDIAALLGRVLVTVEEMAVRYRANTDRIVSSKAMNGAMRKAGVPRLQKQARRANGTRPRVYALANAPMYEAMTDTELGTILDNNPFKTNSA